MIDGEEIPMVSCYKYLGCVVDERLDLKEMVQDKVVAGKKALGAWFQWCRVEVGDIGTGTFKKLMSSLVESSMLYGAEIFIIPFYRLSFPSKCSTPATASCSK